MSRVGKLPITIPDKVSVKIGDDRNVHVKGPKGELNWSLPLGVKVDSDAKSVTVTRESEERTVRALHGTTQRLISNMIVGVSQGYTRNLEIHGVGFRAAVKGSNIDLQLGQSHDRLHPIPKGVKVTVTENTKIAIEGIDKQVVGQLAADIRAYYPPEPYKAKGVRYVGEHIRRKAGKSVK
ncbi:MAG: 50S ribosomal protein L6 [Verrucomicrobiaceae bacterium]|nr:50S ribosomal protein L6 [Verrucomicrobiaceae bacterium]